MRLTHHRDVARPTRRGRGFVTTDRGRREHGYVLVQFALLLVPLMLMAGLSIDVGYWYNRASDIQKAADAAALAGVVWMPNIEKATTNAELAAKRNGFDDADTDITVSVDPVPGNSQQLRVTIEDDTVGSFFYEHLGGETIDLSRQATAEYVLAVPLGSPRNFFGTGTLNSGYDENLWLSINTWCTDKIDGDRYQSQYSGNRPYSSENCPLPVPGTSSIKNPEYRSTGYELYIDVPETRTGPIDVLLYDPRLKPGGGSPDLNLHSNGTQNYTFTLFRADDTPLSDADNVPIASCTKTYTPSTGFESTYSNYLGGSRWNRLCRIGTGTTWPTGRYILRMTNVSGQRFGAAANNFSVVARYASHAGNGLCDARTVATCPRVYGKDAISVFASESSSIADFYLAQIEPVHAGKQLQIELWDPGEGGDNIRFRRPTGTNTWTDARFSWSSDGVGSGTDVTFLDVTGSKFNGKLVEITVDLTGYDPPASNDWWQIRYKFGGGEVTDRTTWSARIVGDPVHLVEEG